MSRYFAGRAAPSVFYALFNGDNGSTGARIGAATRANGIWTEHGLVINVGSSGAWDDVMVRGPWLLHDGSELVCYFDAYDGANFRIGRATASAIEGPWTKYASNPVLGLGGGGDFDSAIVAFPTVLYEPTDTGREWKLWYEGGTSSLGSGNVGYAYSSDGISWTKVGQVLAKGSSGAWDDEGIFPAAIIKAGSTYNLFYGGRKGTTNPQWQGGLATFTDPEGTYTKYASNPVLAHRAGDSPVPSTQLSVTGNPGDTTLTILDATPFSVGEPVVIGDGDSETEAHHVATIGSPTSITLETGLAETMTSGASGTFRSIFFNSVIPRTVRRLPNLSYEMYGSAFQPIDDLTLGGTTLREASFRATAPDLVGPWSFDYATGLLFPLYPAHTGWHQFSAENPSVIAA